MKRIVSLLGLLIWVLFLPPVLGAPPQPCPGPCPVEGCRGDLALNLQKNRTATPAAFKRLTFGQFVKLNDEAVQRKGRDHWTEARRQRIAELEDGKGVTLVGYLYDAKYSVAESCNCFKDELAWRDFHIWIVRNAPHATKPESIVVEITPRIRQNQPGWTLSKLRKLILPDD